MNRGGIFVVGMHRSGTSALSGLLVNMGAYFGPEEQRLPNKMANPKGYWERWDVVMANDRLLARHGLEWHRTAAYRNEFFESMTTDECRAELGAMVEDYEAHRPWFVKDPRICLTLPCWKRLVPGAVAVIVTRDPLQIALSLESRGDGPVSVGLALWEIYTAAAFHHTRNLPRIVVSYERVLTDPVSELRRLLRFFEQNGVAGLTLPPESEVRGWLDKNLQREQLRTIDTPDILNARQQALFDALSEGRLLTAGEPWAISHGGQLALRAYEAQHLRMVSEIADLRVRQAEIEAELGLVRAFKADMRIWNDDLERAADVLDGSLTWKLNRALFALRRALTGRAVPKTPVDRIRDIVAAQKNLQGLGEPTRTPPGDDE